MQVATKTLFLNLHIGALKYLELDRKGIAIDVIKKLVVEKDIGRGWNKVPKITTQIKSQIVGVLLARCQMNNGVTFVLEQERILRNLSSFWVGARSATLLHHNDRVRVYGIVMNISSNRDMFE